MIRVNGVVELSCGCKKRPRSIPKTSIPDLHTETECLTHGQVEVVHTTYVSS
jgi:hypothetical protein